MISGTASAPSVDIDGLIRVTPMAIMALVGISLDIFKIAVFLPPRTLMGIITYVGGLLTLDGKQTAAKMAREIGGVSHDHLTRQLAEEHWTCSDVLLGFIRFITSLGPGGWLILDDTLIPHPRSRKMEGVYWDYDHATGRNVFGQRLVVLLWSNGYWRIPVGFTFWHKKGAAAAFKYRSKNELARVLIHWAIRKGLRPDFIAFDNWYASKNNFAFLQSLHIPFVTRLKKNHRLFFGNKRLQARTIGRRLLQQVRPCRFKVLGQAQARVAQVRLGGCAMSFVVLKNEIDEEPRGVKYLLASTPRLSARDVVLRYKRRWVIEVFFRDVKQHLGLTHYQGRTLAGSHRHVALAFLAAVVVDHLRFRTKLSFEETRGIIQRLVFFCDAAHRFRLATVVPTTPDSLDHFDEAKQVVRSQLTHISQLHFQEVHEMAA